jgi:replication factor C subunit 1
MIVKGKNYFPSFPQWLGKNSSARKAKRLIRELKQAMAHRVSADSTSVQNEIAPFLLWEILGHLKKGSKDSILDLIEYLDDLNITNEMIKEHLMGLNMDKKINDQFEKISSATKSNFTRNYNK